MLFQMQTCCISCGGVIEGVAQFCSDCQARQDTLAGPISISPPPSEVGPQGITPGQREEAPPHRLMDVVFLVAIGGALVGVALWLLALGGTETLGIGGDDSPEQAVVSSPTPGPQATSAPLGYVASECEFEVPEEAQVECGRLTVPQNRAQPDAGTVSLPVAKFVSASSNRQPDPVVYLDGGPGGNTLMTAPILYEVMKPLVENRDLVLFDQRGAGGSEPSLDCPEMRAVDYELLEQQYTVDERVAQDEDAVNECRGRLVSEGVNPAFATSAENAADVNDLRAALGYPQWNLFGVSYGTRLALTVMRDHPDGVRSAILDSTYPPQSDLYSELAPDFSRSLNVMFESCAIDPACSEAFPDLRQTFNETVQGLDQQPVSVTLGSRGGRPVEGAVIDGIWFSAFIFQSLYSTELIPLLPRAIFDTRDGNYDILTLLADAYLQNSEAISPGMYLSVQCGEETPFTNREAALAAAQADPVLQESNEYSAKSIFAACDAWQAPKAADGENQAVSSPIPALVLAGQYDPITPPSWGALAAASLSAGHFFEFPGQAHGVTLSDVCPLGMAIAFLDAPQVAPASGCVGQMSGVEWFAE